ncbi:MAG TPA: aminopeptidase P family N-terminal domain-containing protein, partial [Acidimicrobiia bacterium]|nr:aminopeptidase P family N-terminal domain-containing protein [Acidimicrobiia bacterium]
MNHGVRRHKLASRLEELGVDAFLVTRLPNVRYLTGFTGSNGQLILTAEDAIFLTDGRYGEQSRREAPDVRRAVYTGEFIRPFTEACSDLGVDRVAFESAGLTYKTYRELSDLGRELVPTEQEVERLRWVKDEEEVQRLNEAQALADDAFDLITHKLVEGMSERDAALELDMSLRRAGAENVAFETIMAFGESAAEPHHHPSGRPL